jgi:hypothetical protein
MYHNFFKYSFLGNGPILARCNFIKFNINDDLSGSDNIDFLVHFINSLACCLIKCLRLNKKSNF